MLFAPLKVGIFDERGQTDWHSILGVTRKALYLNDPASTGRAEGPDGGTKWLSQPE